MAHHKRKRARVNSGANRLDRERTARVAAKHGTRWMIGTPPSGFTLKKTHNLRRCNKHITRMAARNRDADRDNPHVLFKRSAHRDWW